jgi:hypothetical protein
MSHIMGEVEKNGKEKIMVTLEDYRGHRLCDCRVYWDDNGTWRPSRKGISLKGESVVGVIALLQKASKDMEG